MVSNLGRLSYNKGKKNLSVRLFARQFSNLISVSAGQGWMGEYGCWLQASYRPFFPASAAGHCTPSPALLPGEASQEVSKLKIQETCLCPDTLVKLRALTNACEKCLKCIWIYLLGFGKISQ